MDEKQGLGFEFCCVLDAAVDEVFAAITGQAAITTFFTDASSAPLEAGRTPESVITSVANGQV